MQKSISMIETTKMDLSAASIYLLIKEGYKKSATLFSNDCNILK